MLHDLYLLSCYFDRPQAVLYDEEMTRRYGRPAIAAALREGLIELYCAPCAKGRRKMFCRLSGLGIGRVESAMA